MIFSSLVSLFRNLCWREVPLLENAKARERFLALVTQWLHKRSHMRILQESETNVFKYSFIVRVVDIWNGLDKNPGTIN